MSSLRMNNLNDVATEIHNYNCEAGWWDKEEKGWVSDLQGNGKNRKLGALLVSTKIALVHSEMSESLEGMRKGLMDDHLPHRTMIEVELADAIIRILDIAGAMNLDVGGAVAEKFEYNKQRADHKKENREASGGKMI